jgi:hypothetical protein
VRQWAEAIAGIAIVALIFYDLFQSVVLPRPSVGKLRLSTFVIRPLWAVCGVGSATAPAGSAAVTTGSGPSGRSR